ncbi:MAG: creatininase family protein, partial [Acidobacteriota bacterium]
MTRPIAESPLTQPASSTRNQMLRGMICAGAVLAMLLTPRITAAQPNTQSESGKLSANWEDLTGPDFIQAIRQAQGVCLLPFGIMEKHGTQLPIGTDLIDVRYASFQAAKQAYAVIFPPYYFGQIAEARHQPGTISYPAHLQMQLLQNTTDEMARNGCKKIVIVNGHGGNESFLPYFAQSQLDTPHDYVVYIYWWQHDEPGRPAHRQLPRHTSRNRTRWSAPWGACSPTPTCGAPVASGRTPRR